MEDSDALARPEAVTPSGVALRHTGQEFHLLRGLTRAHQAFIACFRREVGMPAARLLVMRVLALSERGDMGVLEIARSLGVDPAAATRQVKDLEGCGLVARRDDPDDKRRVLIRLTEKGARLFERLHARAHEFEEALAKELDAADIATAARVLEHVRARLDEFR